MSQQQNFNQPNYGENYLTATGFNSNNTFLQGWSNQNPGASIPRPNSSTSTFQGRPSLGNAQRGNSLNFNQTNSTRQHGQIDPNLDLFPIPQPASSRAVVTSELHPLLRFYQDDAPWTPESASTRHGGAPAKTRNGSLPVPNVEFRQYRPGPGSERESNAPSDSGYHSHTLSHPRTQSVVSMEPEQCNQELPDIPCQLKNLAFTPGSNGVVDRAPSERSSRTEHDSGKIVTHKNARKCPDCGEVAKCPSDYKKHLLKHEKPFKCDIRGCRRGDKGFTTINDLTRHKKSVHRIGNLKKSYQCASENCRNKEKIWPRLDNFKQHVHRMHNDEDQEELIQRSSYTGRTPAPPNLTLSVAPMDTTLAGIGTVKTPSTHDLNDDGSGNLSLTPEQSYRPWDTFEVSPLQEFSMNGRHPENGHQLYAPSPGKANLERSSGLRPSEQTRGNTLSPNPPHWHRNSGSPNAGLSALATVASNAPPHTSADRIHNQRAPNPPVLSRAPQTKAEQQDQAIKSFVRLIVNNVESGGDIDIETVVSALKGAAVSKKNNGKSPNLPFSAKSTPMNLNDTLFSNKRINPDDSEALKIMTQEAMDGLKLLQERILKRSRESSGPKPMSGTGVTCPKCNKMLPRKCDLKKHIKRHIRPYGCTFPRCKKKFGSKSDWKRHETSQHFQTEAFRCPIISSNQICGEVFYRKERFQDHLKSVHSMSKQNDILRELKACRIGTNGQGQFWCGFCNKVVPLQKKPGHGQAWDERIDHIYHHFDKEERHIEDWICLEANKPKGDVFREMSYYRNHTNDIEEEEDDLDMDSSSQDLGDSQEPSPKHSESSDVDASPTSDDQFQLLPANPRKRRRIGDTNVVSSQGRDSRSVWYCCQCDFSPAYNIKTYGSCIECEHAACNYCIRKRIVDDTEMDD